MKLVMQRCPHFDSHVWVNHIVCIPHATCAGVHWYSFWWSRPGMLLMCVPLRPTCNFFFFCDATCDRRCDATHCDSNGWFVSFCDASFCDEIDLSNISGFHGVLSGFHSVIDMILRAWCLSSIIDWSACMFWCFENKFDFGTGSLYCWMSASDSCIKTQRWHVPHTFKKRTGYKFTKKQKTKKTKKKQYRYCQESLVTICKSVGESLACTWVQWISQKLNQIQPLRWALALACDDKKTGISPESAMAYCASHRRKWVINRALPCQCSMHICFTTWCAPNLAALAFPFWLIQNSNHCFLSS